MELSSLHRSVIPCMLQSRRNSWFYNYRILFLLAFVVFQNLLENVGYELPLVYMKQIEWLIRSKTQANWDFLINPVVFLYSIYMKWIDNLSIRSTSIVKSSRLTLVLWSDRLENVWAASCKHVKRIDDIDTRDYFLKTHACFTEKQVFNQIDRSILSM